jgi:hypothetical protein
MKSKYKSDVWFRIPNFGRITKGPANHLVTVLSKDLDTNRYYLIALTTPNGQATTVDEVLERHAHENLGTFKDETTARAKADRYAKKWLKIDQDLAKHMKLCDCGPVGVVPTPSKVAKTPQRTYKKDKARRRSAR